MLSTVFLLLLNASVGNACSAFYSISPVSGGLSIKYDLPGGTHEVLDDDGFIALGIIAGFCNDEAIEPAAETWTLDQRACAREKANVIVAKRAKPQQLQTILDECHFDLKKQIEDAELQNQKENLSCAEKVRAAAKNITQRFSEIVKEKSNPNYLLKLKLSGEAKDQFTADLNSKFSLAKEFESLSNSKFSRREFLDWRDRFKILSKSEKFQVGHNAGYAAEDLILNDIGVNLGSQRSQSMCGLDYRPFLQSLSEMKWPIEKIESTKKVETHVVK